MFEIRNSVENIQYKVDDSPRVPDRCGCVCVKYAKFRRVVIGDKAALSVIAVIKRQITKYFHTFRHTDRHFQQT